MHYAYVPRLLDCSGAQVRVGCAVRKVQYRIAGGLDWIDLIDRRGALWSSRWDRRR